MVKETESVQQDIAALSQQLTMLELRFGYELSDEVTALGERLSSQLEDAMARLFTDLSPLEVAHELKYERIPGYEFFGVYAEPWQDDPAIARAEQRLYELLDTPIVVADCDRNRAELEGWRQMRSLYVDHTPISRDDLLERADRVLACTNEIPPEPTKRIWATMAKSAKIRDELRRKHVPVERKSVKKLDKPVALKRTAKEVAPKAGRPKSTRSKDSTGPRGRSAAAPTSSNRSRTAPKVAASRVR
jgi:hypothetical protein